jgi:tetratricopeptide (TPR) repeat protein
MPRSPGPCRFRTFRSACVLAWATSLLCPALPAPAEDHTIRSDERLAAEAKAVWESGAITPALDMLDEEIRHHPDALPLLKLRGDILSTSRGPREAVAAYDTVLAKDPTALDARWAKWGVLVRWGQAEDAVAELRRLAEMDAGNPLIHLRLAQELRKLDHLEESLHAYENAVALVPDLLGWRLSLARARFDLLDYRGADGDVEYVLQRAPPGSPLELPAKNLRSVIYESMDRGRRFKPTLTPDADASALKEWAAIRADAWKLFAAGRYAEAEPIYRRVLALNPKDPLATHQLGITLMQLGRCRDALALFGNVLNLNPSEEDYADTVFRMGRCLVELEQWEDAYVHFKLLYDTAAEFEARNKDVPLPEGTRVLDKAKLAAWLDKIRPHVPELADAQLNEPATAGPSDGAAEALSEEALLAQAVERLKPQQTLETRTSLLGRDADFSWFRFVIPAGKVMRDDFPTGAHEFIPLNPGDSFPAAQPDIYLVFGLVSASYDAIPLTARCVLETSEMANDQRIVAQDEVMTAMNDQSGYFLLSRPAAGWTPGLYRCGLFAGERTSAYTQVDEVRFRIAEPARASTPAS